MAQHGPEAAKGPGRDSDPQLGDIPFEKRRHVLVSLQQALIVRRGQEGWGQSPAPLQGLDGPGIDIAEVSSPLKNQALCLIFKVDGRFSEGLRERRQPLTWDRI